MESKYILFYSNCLFVNIKRLDIFNDTSFSSGITYKYLNNEIGFVQI